MSRSSYIYPVLHNGEPIAAFTVKREMVGWMRNRPNPLLPGLKVYRMRDGNSHTHEAVLLDTKELLA